MKLSKRHFISGDYPFKQEIIIVFRNDTIILGKQSTVSQKSWDYPFKS
jgi:hypothetical protein